MYLRSTLLLIPTLFAVLAFSCTQASTNPSARNTGSSPAAAAGNIVAVATPEVTPTAAAAPAPTATAVPTPASKPAAPLPESPSSPGDAKEIGRGPTSGNMVALTFDAGSASGPTSKILDILKENNLKVTMFVTGQYVDTYPDLVRRMAQEGHQIANHSYSHPDFTTFSNQQILDELARTEQSVLRVTGKSSKPYMRMPFGARNSRVTDTVVSAGYRSIYWTLDSGDWLENATPNAVTQRILQNVGPGYIVVQHVNSVATSDSLREVISGIKEKGLRIVSLSELLG